MKAVVLEGPKQAQLAAVAEPRVAHEDEILLQVRRIGLCGTDLNSYRGANPLVTFPRIPGHEIAATVAELNPKYPEWQPGTQVAISPYKNCGQCASCRRQRPNACQYNQTLGVQRDGALTEFIAAPAQSPRGTRPILRRSWHQTMRIAGNSNGFGCAETAGGINLQNQGV